MGRFFNMDTPVMRFLSRVGELMILSALWLVCCCGIVTVGAATAALHRCVFNLRADKPGGPVTFFRAFRDNFIKATVLWLLVLVAAAALFGLYLLTLLIENDIAAMAVMVVLCLVFFVTLIFTVWAFPLAAYFHNTLGGTMKNALLLGLGQLKSSIPACALVLLPWVALLFMGEMWFGLLVFWLFLAPGAVSWGVTGVLQGVFSKYAEGEHGISADKAE